MNVKVKRSLKIFAVFVALIIAIIASASLWNVVAAGSIAVIGTFEVVVSVINFFIELYLLGRISKKLIFED